MALPTVMVEIAFPSGASTSTWLHLDDSARGKLNTGTLGPTDATWVDVSDYVMSAGTRRGASRISLPVIRYEAGTCTIVLDNSDRRFDPANLSGPYVSAGMTEVTPMRAVRIRASWAGVSYDLFRGFADEWRITYSDPGYSEVTLTASDAFKVLGNLDRAAGGSVGAGEDSGARVNRVLDSASWSPTDRVVATGDTTLQATTLEGNALSELQLVADTEVGEFYVDGAGRATFRNRNAILTDSRSGTSQGTFGDGGGAELAYESVEVAYDDVTLANQVRATRVGGTEQLAQDATSQALYLARTHQADGLLMQDDATAAQWAAYIVGLASEPELRFAAVTITPHQDEANLYPQVLGRQIGDRITIVRRPPGGGSAITRDAFIRGIEHALGSDDPLSWVTVWTLESATKFAFFVLDSTTLGQLDDDALAY
jgi:hypothetical protein